MGNTSLSHSQIIFLYNYLKYKSIIERFGLKPLVEKGNLGSYKKHGTGTVLSHLFDDKCGFLCRTAVVNDYINEELYIFYVHGLNYKARY